MGDVLRLEPDYRFDGTVIESDHVDVSIISDDMIMVQRSNTVSIEEIVRIGVKVGVQIPSENCRSILAADQSWRSISVNPNLWFIEILRGRATEFVEQFDQAREGKSVFACDVSDQLVTVSVSGTGARDLLAKGSSIDFRPEEFLIDHSARGLLGRVNVIFTRVAENSYHLSVDASLFIHLRKWLETVLAK